MLSEMSQTTTNTVWSHLYAKSKTTELIKTEKQRIDWWLPGAGGGWLEMTEMGKCGQKLPTSSYKMDKLWRYHVQCGDIINNIVLYR